MRVQQNYLHASLINSEKINMPHTPTVIKDLIRLGCNVRITPGHAPTALKDYVRLAVQKGAHITIDATNIAPTVAKDLARLGGLNVTLIV